MELPPIADRQKTIMKKIILTFLLFVAFTLTNAQNDTLFNRHMNGILTTIKQIDSSANPVKRQRIYWCRKRIKIKYYSATNNTIKHKVVIRSKNGQTYARHKLKTGYSTLIRLTTVDDIPIFISRKNLYDNIKYVLTFAYLGNSKWYFNYRVDNEQTKKYFVTRDTRNWR
jgi:small nuclear ribonucleoprotein (snRNP)-like protein